VAGKKSNLQWVKDHFYEIEKETESKIAKDVRHIWLVHGDMCNDMFGSLSKVLSKDEESDSLLVLRLFEFQKTLLWLDTCANCGSYRPLIRELRFFLESFMQALYMDEKYPEADMREKLLLLHKNEKRLYGFNLINKLELEEKDDIKGLYHRLSNFVHGSAVELFPILNGNVHDRFVATFDEDFFHQCVINTDETVDWIFYLIIKKHPRVGRILKRDSNTFSWFKRLGYERTVKIIKDVSQSHRQSKLTTFFK